MSSGRRVSRNHGKATTVTAGFSVLDIHNIFGRFGKRHVSSLSQG